MLQKWGNLLLEIGLNGGISSEVSNLIRERFRFYSQKRTFLQSPVFPYKTQVKTP